MKPCLTTDFFTVNAYRTSTAQSHTKQWRN